jgi:transcription elongation factor SPT6
MSIRQLGRTPNPYGGQTPFTSTGPSNYGIPPNGYQTPHRPPFSGQPPTMPPNLNAAHPAAAVWNQSWSS